MQVGKKSLAAGRLVCLVVTGVALWIVFRRVDSSALLEAFRTMDAGWFVAAIAAYGLVFVPAAWRWHLALRQTNAAVHPGAAGRLSLIGHFFYTILFGAAGGDTAKSAVYARWYRLPLPEVLAAAPLDRLMGFGGLLLFGLLAVMLGVAGGGFVRLKSISMEWPTYWLAGMIVGITVIVMFVLRGKRDSARGRFAGAFVSGGKRLLKSPRVFAQGILCGFLVQVGLNSALAFNLEAVSEVAVPWARLAWTFPVICILSALPITVAGLGVREGAALALLGLYGITSANAVAASLLTLTASMVWLGVGGLLFWREGNRQERSRELPKTISAVIPVLDDAPTLVETIRSVRAVPEICEIIIVDGGSRDQTCELATQQGCLVVAGAPAIEERMQLGATRAKGDVILFLGADTRVPPHAGRAALDALRDATVAAGGFWNDSPGGVPWFSRLKCALFFYLGGRFADGQPFFVRREIIQSAEGNEPGKSQMKHRARRAGRFAMADATVTTSGSRTGCASQAHAARGWTPGPHGKVIPARVAAKPGK